MKTYVNSHNSSARLVLLRHAANLLRTARRADRAGYGRYAERLERSAQAATATLDQSEPSSGGLGDIHTDNGSVHQVVDQFINGGTMADPQFIKDQTGQAHLLIHGSPPQDGEVYFFIGNGKTFNNNPPGYVRQEDLDDWMESMGYPAQTPVIGCYSGAAQGVNSEFGNQGEIQVSAPSDGSGDDLQFSAASTDRANLLRARRLAAGKTKAAEEATKGKRDYFGIPLYIEYPKGSYREKTGPDGKPWRRKMTSDYGRINGTKGKDGDCIDVFCGPDMTSKQVFIVNQVSKDGKFDEHKVVVGVRSEKAARSEYLGNYPKGWTCGDITGMSLQNFKNWLKSGDKKIPV